MLSVLTSLCLWGGFALAGNTGVLVALVLSGVMNLGAYWFSARFVLRLYGAREVSLLESPYLFRLIRRASRGAGLLVPRVYLIPENAPNAFATGRNQKHGAVAVTDGLLRLLNEEELEAVLAHELVHVRNRDTLLAGAAATLAGAFSSLANFALWGVMLGAPRGKEDRGAALSTLFTLLFSPIAATLVRLSVSRTREFAADKASALITGNPLALASALEKMERESRAVPFYSGSLETAHLFIQNPFPNARLAKLFRTHPPTAERVRRLRAMAPIYHLAA
ncbi:MAG: M48 family metalloprotease [Bryobacterales bacterium]|nr:M48 family metalloprotease [Bryobacterales bacterium]